jgi:hypothetical protein
VSGRSYFFVVFSAVGILVLILRQVRLRRLRAKYALIWLTAGAVVLPIAMIPGLLDDLASLLDVAYPPALLLVGGLGFFALLSLHFSTELTRLEERTRVLAEEAALLRNRLERDHPPLLVTEEEVLEAESE